MTLSLSRGSVLTLLLFGCGAEPASTGEGSPRPPSAGAASGGASTAHPLPGAGTAGQAVSLGGSAGSSQAGTGGGSSSAGAVTGGTSGSGGLAGVSGSGGSALPLLDGELPPGENFDLSRWNITFPDGKAEPEAWLTAGNERPDEFFTDPATGGMVFRVPNIGGTTANSSYSRTELRGMLRAGNTEIDTRGLNANNWVFSSSSASSQAMAGGVDGVLEATLRVDHVSTSGDAGKVGRVIVGQIHASENEPCRLYYRKLPNNERGSFYFAHEPNQGEESFIELVGSRENDAADPADGVALGETFSYRIEAKEHELTVTILRPGHAEVSQSVNMSESGFADDWMYFKAGAYNQNNTGSNDDYAQVTFFALEATHD